MRVFVLLALIALAACTRTMDARELSSTGNRQLFDDAVIAKVIEGMSTKADVRRNFGDPNSVSFGENGAGSWLYTAAVSRMQPMTVGPGGYVGGQTQMDMRTVTVLFAENGIVRKLGVGQSRSCGGPGGTAISC